MKVILKQSVPKLGKQGQVVNVKDGYARNYLFPQGMAVVADKTQLVVLERRNAKIASELSETKAQAEKLKEKIDGKEISIEANVGGDSTRLFGAITSQDIADAIKKDLGQEFEKKQILLAMPIKQLGRYAVEIDAHRQVDIKVFVNVFDPTAPEPTEEAVEAAPVVEASAAPAEVEEAAEATEEE